MSKNSSLFIGVMLIILGAIGLALASRDSWPWPSGVPLYRSFVISGYRAYSSNGERIYLTGVSESGQRIQFSGGPMWLWMHGGSCVSCHGPNGKGGVPVMMGTEVPANITYEALTKGEHEENGEGAHAPYTDDLIKRAITKGLDSEGEPLDPTMPRWRMSEKDLNDLIAYLKTLP